MKIIDCSYLKFATPQQSKDWLSGFLFDSLLIKISYAAFLHFQMTGQIQVVTSLIRENKIHDKDSRIHAIGRAGDLSVLAFGDDAGKLEAWAAKINRTFPYFGKPGAVTCLVHDVGQGLHAHIQVGPDEKVPFKEVKNG